MKVAGGRIEWEGETYDWGDPVPASLEAEHPEWLTERRPTAADVEAMTEAEAKTALLVAYGLVSADDAGASTP